MKKVIFLCFLGVAAMWGSAFGDVAWQPTTSSTNWSTVANWSGGVLPGTGDIADITEAYAGPGKADVTLDISANCMNLTVGYVGNGTLNVQNSLTIGNQLATGVASGTGTINMNSAAGSITINGIAYLGYNGTGDSVLNISAGTINLPANSTYGAGYFVAGYAGNSLINMSGGTINADAFFLNDGYAVNSTVNLSGGTINTNYLSILAGNSVVNMSGTGKIVLTTGSYGMTMDLWLPYINGWMGTNILNGQYTTEGNQIIITAAPEPATLLLLGLGGLLLKRRNA